jgi:hypothetical protein
MSVEEKIEALLRSLIEGTTSGRFQWSADPGTGSGAEEARFRLNLNSGPIVIEKEEYIDGGSGYKLTVLDRHDKLVDAFESVLYSPVEMETLWKQARGQARNTDQVLEDLLKEVSGATK